MNNSPTIKPSTVSAKQKSLRRLVLRHVTKHNNKFTRYVHAKQLSDANPEYVIRQVFEAIDALLAQSSLVEIKDGKYCNLAIPSYVYDGRPISVRDLVKHPDNTHNLAYTTILNRLRKGLTPKEALTTPDQERYSLAKTKRQKGPSDLQSDLQILAQ